MTENMTDPKPTRKELNTAWAAYEAAWQAAEKGGLLKVLTPAYTEYIGRQLLQALEIAY